MKMDVLKDYNTHYNDLTQNKRTFCTWASFGIYSWQSSQTREWYIQYSTRYLLLFIKMPSMIIRQQTRYFSDNSREYWGFHVCGEMICKQKNKTFKLQHSQNKFHYDWVLICKFKGLQKSRCCFIYQTNCFKYPHLCWKYKAHRTELFRDG